MAVGMLVCVFVWTIVLDVEGQREISSCPPEIELPSTLGHKDQSNKDFWICVQHFFQSGNMTCREIPVNLSESDVRETSWPQEVKNYTVFHPNVKDNIKNTCATLVEKLYTLFELNACLEELNNTVKNMTILVFDKGITKDLLNLVKILEQSVSYYKLAFEKVSNLRKLIELYNATDIFNVTCFTDLLCENKWRSRMEHETNTLNYFKKVRETSANKKPFRKYIDPAVFGFILVTGIMGNGILLFIFARHKDVRSSPNMIILNLIVGDTLNLLINLPLHYAMHYNRFWMGGILCPLYEMVRFTILGVSALSVVCVSIQRYFAVIHSLKAKRITNRYICVYIFSVWIVAIFVSLPESFNYIFVDKVCTTYDQNRRMIASVVLFLFYCIVCPCVMIVFSVLMATRLRNSTRDVPNQIRNISVEHSRKRSAKVLKALAISFVISYVPWFTWMLVRYCFGSQLETLPNLVFEYIDSIAYYLLFLNVCFNPLALYFASSTFRKPVNMYLFSCCRRRKNKRQSSSRGYGITVQERNTEITSFRRNQ
ncbi:bombesin receptor subtype-3-like [Periplaneta americana]|uniref:bombesin receptor subtype-3-like n=1 Tax=Periplaneta americana TaxID=6978 RepID=UPI0037E77DC5